VSSRYAAREVGRELEVPADRITVCSPGAPEWAAAVARERADQPHGSAILFVGTLDPRKNLPGLLDAYAELRARRPDAPPLVLAGRVTASVRIELKRTERSPLAGQVTVAGYVSNSERRRLYRDARMLVLPSFEEGFGLPVLEAMACGLPVVISNRGSLPEVAGEAASPIDPLDADALATEMERLLDPDAAGVAAANGLAQAARFSWDSTARAARTAYGRAVAARARRA
jgi:glycosyltransferase involved in cell wall biosynthesis